MIKISRRSFAAGVAGAVGIAVLPKATFAQEGTSGLLGMIPGLQSAYARRYNAEAGAHGIEPEIEENEATPSYMLTMGLTFEDAEILATVIENMLSPDLAAMVIASSEVLTESTVEDIEGSRLFATGDDVEHYDSLLVVSKDNVAFLVSTSGHTAAVQETANAVAKHMLEEDLSEDEVEIVSEGVAKGGVFESFPGEDEMELLNGLAPRFDYDLLVSESPIGSEESTPES